MEIIRLKNDMNKIIPHTRIGYGEYFTHSFGHSLGIDIHEAPSASPSETAVLPAGAVISAEPGIYLPGKVGVRIEDLVLVTRDGVEILNRYPKELTVILAEERE